MQRTVLTVVGALYTLLGLWCTFSPRQTSQSVGFTLSEPGLIEYVTVYGGLEVGLGAAMIIGARNPILLPGVFFMTTVVSVCLPLFRAAMLLAYESNTVVLAILVLELLIALALLVTLARTRLMPAHG